MITNERQYKITRAQADKFQLALARNDELDLIRSGIDPLIAAAHKQALREQLKELTQQLRDYEILRAGAAGTLETGEIAKIGQKLIQARISRGLTQSQLASRLGLKAQQIQRYEQEQYLTANLQRIGAIADALSLTVSITFSISDKDREAFGESKTFDSSKLPTREMRKRGWLDDASLGPHENYRSDQERAAAFVRLYQGHLGTASLHRMKVRAGSTLNDHAMLAWKARVLQRAKKFIKEIQPYEPLDASFIKMLAEFSQYPDGPCKAISALRERGVAVVVEPHLKGTHLDGAAMLLDSQYPVIGLTLRYDRLDNFWFTLFHEMGHIIRHREKGLKEGFFDDNTAGTEDALEAEADEFAENALIPTEAWKISFVRFTRSTEEVEKFAKRYKIGKSVVAGRIRRERGYHLFKDLVGSGCVRELLASANLTDR